MSSSPPVTPSLPVVALQRRPVDADRSQQLRDVPTKHIVRMREQHQLCTLAKGQDSRLAAGAAVQMFNSELDRRRRDLSFDPADLLDGEASLGRQPRGAGGHELLMMGALAGV